MPGVEESLLDRGKVAIILVNYNGAKDTIECIESIKHTTYEDYEIIVVDNCSTDDSVSILEEYSKRVHFVFLRAEYNNGFSAGNNIAIKEAIEKGFDYILLLNNDTVVTSDYLEKLIAGFSCSRSCGVTISKINYEKDRDIIWYAGGNLNFRTSRTEHWNYNKKDAFEIKKPCKVSFATGCCMCLSKDVIKKVGLMDEDYFLYEEDADYCSRILMNGFDIYYIPDSVIYHKVSKSTGNASPLSQYYLVRNKYLLIRKNNKFFNKPISYMYTTLRFIVRCIKGELKFKYFREAFKAFMKNEIGKSDNKFLT